jgi:hypothetical protein
MILRDLLGELRRNILRDVSTAASGRDVDDSIWTDDTLLLYIRDAEEKFASRTLCLRDSRSTEATRLTLVEGQDDYPLDRRVVAVLTAQYDTQIVLGRAGWATRFGSDAQLTPNTSYSEPQESGAPRIFYTDRDAGYLGVYPIPSAAEAGKTIRLQVARLPLVPLTKNNLDAEPEIPHQWHLDLVEWAAWRALRNHDPDLDNDANDIALVRSKFEQHRTRFEAAVEECKREMKQLNVQQVVFGPRANWS